MNGILFASLSLSFILLLIAAFLAWREGKLKREFEQQKADLLHKYYEVTLLNALLGKVGEAFSYAEIPQYVVGASERFIQMSAASYCLYHEGQVFLSTTVREGVSEQYVNKLKDIMLESFRKASGVEQFTVTKHDIHNDYLSNTKSYSETELKSYFNVPLVYKNEIVGMLLISSARAQAFSEEDMVLFYQVVSRISTAFERIEGYVSSQQTSLSTLVSSLPGGAMMFLVEGNDAKLTFMNSTAKQYLQIRGEASAVAVLSTFPRRDEMLTKLQEALADKKSIWISETQVYDKYFKVYINPIMREGVESKIVSVTLQDITLEREIEEVRENFMHTVVHELRAPMTSIKGASDLLLNKELSEEDKKKMLSMIHQQTERMLSDITDLLDAAKIESGKLSVEMAEADVNNVIAERVGTFTYLAEEKKIQITQELGQVPQFSFDAMRVGQVINNLISNALKYTNSEGKVKVSSRVDGDRCIVSVADTGQGIPEDKKPLLFSKFGQVGHTAGSHPGGSSGLGLYIVKGIIESHGGEIWVDSIVGKGTTVSFYLPMKQIKANDNSSSSDRPVSRPVRFPQSQQQVVN